MRRAARDADRVGAGHCGLEREPVDRRALFLRLLGHVVVYGERERHFAGDHHVVEQRVPGAGGDPVLRDEVAEELEPLLAPAHHVDHRGEPVLILRLDAELALPPGVEEIPVRPRQVFLPDELRVVDLHPHREERGGPFAVRRHRAGLQILVHRRIHRLQDLLARKRLHLGRTEMDQVHVVLPCGRLGERALQHLVGARAPDVDLDAVLRFEGLDQRRLVLLGESGVHRERAIFLRRRDDPLHAVGAAVVEERLRCGAAGDEPAGAQNGNRLHGVFHLSLPQSRMSCRNQSVGRSRPSPSRRAAS